MEFDGVITMGEALDITEQEGKFISESEHTVHTIIEVSTVKGAPKEFLSNLPRIANMPAANHPNAGSKLVVRAKGFAATILNVFSNVYRKIINVDTLADAHKYIEEEHNILIEG